MPLKTAKKTEDLGGKIKKAHECQAGPAPNLLPIVDISKRIRGSSISFFVVGRSDDF